MRYIIFNGSISRHCCFEFSVLDTTRPVILDGKHKEDENGKHYEAVCECFYKDDATRICLALNAADEAAASCRWDWSSYHGLEITACGHGIAADSKYKFCPFCGKKVGQE